MCLLSMVRQGPGLQKRDLMQKSQPGSQQIACLNGCAADLATQNHLVKFALRLQAITFCRSFESIDLNRKPM